MHEFSNRVSISIHLGEAASDVREKSGQSRYNVKIRYVWTEDMGETWKQLVEKFEKLGIISQDGGKCVTKSMFDILGLFVE